MDLEMHSTEYIFGIKVQNIYISETIEKIENHILTKKKITVIPLNVDMVQKTFKDKEFLRILNNNNIVVIDGVPLIWVAKIFGIRIKERNNGTNLFVSLCELAALKKYRLFFLGAAPGIAQKASTNLQTIYKDLKVEGVYSPPFGFEDNPTENNDIIKKINKIHPDILFVGLGAPKQEKWIHLNRKRLNVSVIMAVGGAFDFISGNVKRAPKWMQQHGLEWFHRLCMEPKRLWKRYLIDDMIFFPLILIELSKKYFDKILKKLDHVNII